MKEELEATGEHKAERQHSDMAAGPEGRPPQTDRQTDVLQHPLLELASRAKLSNRSAMETNISDGNPPPPGLDSDPMPRDHIVQKKQVEESV